MAIDTALLSMSDIDLLQASCAGQTEAFGRLVARYQSLVCAVAYRACGDMAASEDLAQEAFVLAWRKLDELRDASRFGAWVCGMVRNLARSSRRHQRHHAPAATEPMERLANVAAAGPSPLEHLLTRQEQDLVREALKHIPQAYREPLVLFYREQKSLEQVAEVLAISPTLAKQRLCRGRKQLERGIRQLMADTARQPRKNLAADHRASRPARPHHRQRASRQAVAHPRRTDRGACSAVCAAGIICLGATSE